VSTKRPFVGLQPLAHWYQHAQNGILMSAGIDAVSVPAAKTQEFNENMVQFYMAKDATEMMSFLANCHPDAERIRQPSFARIPSL